MTRATDSHDAGMQAHDAGLPRDTYTSDFWITRAAWLAGWDSAADLKANPPASWDDVAVTLPTRAARVISPFAMMCLQIEARAQCANQTLVAGSAGLEFSSVGDEHSYTVIYTYTGRRLYVGDNKRAALDACKRNGNASSLMLCDGIPCDKRSGKPANARRV